jgi:hypothetical protein
VLFDIRLELGVVYLVRLPDLAVVGDGGHGIVSDQADPALDACRADLRELGRLVYGEVFHEHKARHMQTEIY